MKPSQVSSTLRRIASAIEKSRKPDKSLIAQDLKKIVAILLKAPSKKPKIQEQKVWEFLWGRTKPWVYRKFPPGVNPDEYEDLTDYLEQNPEETAGSGLFWSAFEELDIVDWSPITDPEPIIEKTRELARELKEGDYGFNVGTDRHVDWAKRNWKEYRDTYMNDDIKKLVDNGIVDQATIDNFQKKLRDKGL